MSKNTKIFIAAVLGCFTVALFTIIMFIIIPVVAAVLIPIFVESHKHDKLADIAITKTINAKFQEAALLYKIKQEKVPKQFSDFVLYEGDLREPYTYSLKSVKDRLIVPSSQQDLETDNLNVEFISGAKATYKLHESDIIFEPG